MWDINDVRVGRRNGDDLLIVLLILGHFHLLRVFQVAHLHRLLTQALNGCQYARLISQEGTAQLGRPIHLQAHHVHDGREVHQRHGGRRKAQRRNGGGQLFPFEIGVGDQPVAGIEHLLRIGGAGQHLRQYRIRVKRYGRKQGFERLRGICRCWCVNGLPLRCDRRAGSTGWVGSKGHAGLSILRDGRWLLFAGSQYRAEGDHGRQHAMAK
ncbi:hypothetical protein D3C84_610020 [compost metagenome]